jgi:hypothetical protein
MEYIAEPVEVWLVDCQAAFPYSSKRPNHTSSSSALITPSIINNVPFSFEISHFVSSLPIYKLLTSSNMTQNCGAPSRLIAAPLFNVTEVYQQRWEDSPKDDRKRLEMCWGYTDCGDCYRSDGHCGWCAIVSVHFLLLHKTICRGWQIQILPSGGVGS